MEINNEEKQKLINLANAIKESLTFIEMPVDDINLSWSSISSAGIFSSECSSLLQKLEEMGIISNFELSVWPIYNKNNVGNKEKKMVEGFSMEVNTKKLNAFINSRKSDASHNSEESKLQISFITEKGIGYLKFYKQGPKIGIGGAKTRKYRLLESLFDPLGIAKTVNVVFDKIQLPKDKGDSRLAHSYFSEERQRELIIYTMKELQKIKELKGKIKLEFINNKRSVRLLLDV